MGNSQGKPVEFDGEGTNTPNAPCLPAHLFATVEVDAANKSIALTCVFTNNSEFEPLPIATGRRPRCIRQGPNRRAKRHRPLVRPQVHSQRRRCAPTRWNSLLRVRHDADLLRPTVVRSESVRNIIRERRMLEHVNHPFICNLRYSFQDIEYMYAPPPLSLL